MSDADTFTYTVNIHKDEDDNELWATIDELPGLFASGADEDELNEALAEAIGMYLSTPKSRVEVRRASTAPAKRVDSYRLCAA